MSWAKAWMAGVALVGMTGPSQSLEYCEDLWFTRNLMFHNAGHCFGSPLGKAVFDTGSCIASGAILEAPALDIVNRVKKAEALEGCAVDTKATTLAIPLLDVRKALIDAPIPSLSESVCIGWKGAPVELRSARDKEGTVIGTARPGDTMLFQFEEAQDWSFIEVMQNGISLSMGWAQFELDEKSCEMVAG